MIYAIYGVTDLLKINLPVCTGFMLGLMLSGGSLAENTVSSGYPYQPVSPQLDAYSGYRWRPVEKSYSPTEFRVPAQRSGVTTEPGGPQSTMNVPTGTYRPVEERYTQYPQVGNFRFRSVSPEEQSRIERDGATQVEVMSGRYTGQMKYRDDDTSPPYQAPEINYNYKFRPDARFLNSQIREKNWESMTGSTPTYPPVYTAPVFRDPNRKN